ncbi:retrovirus-related pol polyprotein from transposon TNT 1-94 [Tanacetum coccineum]|uniref:Retrovirus-related pol polyprotein from transposon TNT 1-94 n=1 Tax=Tanacetum coccineum TaxID=301880 RepID=A0ABQ5D5W8_9ASTR
MSQDVLLTVMNYMSLIDESVNVERKRKESCDKCFNLEAELLKSQNAHNDLLKSYSQLEKHCISLELSIQLNQEIFQKDDSCNNQNALEIPNFFKSNDLKARLQDKDSTICKLKNIIKLMREKSKEKNVKYDYGEIKTKNVELENSVAKLILENEHLCNEINHVKQEQADILRGIVEQAKAKQHLDKELDFACSSKKAKSIESKNANHSEPNHPWGPNATDIPSSFSLVMTGCPDCSLLCGLWMFETYDREPLSAHELFEGFGHNLFSVGQFCDADLEVAFRKNTCFICNLEGVDLLSKSRDTNLYIISLDDMLKTSPICLLSKASKTKSWLWHHRLSHLNFGTLNKLAKDGLARGIPRLKF